MSADDPDLYGAVLGFLRATGGVITRQALSFAHSQCGEVSAALRGVDNLHAAHKIRQLAEAWIPSLRHFDSQNPSEIELNPTRPEA
jgi:hypothetical protein